MTRLGRGLVVLLAFGAVVGALRPAAAADWWRPKPGASWQIQLNEPPKTLLDVAVYDLDLFDTPPATIEAIHKKGRRVICYFSAGSYENWRPDKDRFPMAALGRPLSGWPRERWLDVRSEAVRGIMRDRLDLAASKKCDAVDPDNVDGYANGSGFPRSANDQIGYNRFLADEAHRRGLAVGLKNDVEQIPNLVASFDFAVNEECFAYDECDRLQPFLDAGKPVFQIEYGNAKKAKRICPQANRLGFETLIKRLSLDSWRVACRR